MVLADTSVWIEHFRHGHARLRSHLADGLVLMHPFVSGELACGNLKDRSEVLFCLNEMPAAKLATHGEVMTFMEKHRLWGRGLGLVDLHLLASALLSDGQFWTFDKKLAQAASDLGLD